MNQPTQHMKSQTLLFLAAFTSALAIQSATADNRIYIVATAEGLPQPKGEEVLRASVDLLLKSASPGDRVQFLDAPRATRLADLTVPSGTARERANSRDFAGKLQAVKSLLNTASPGDPRLVGQLRLAQLLDAICRVRKADEPITLIVIGSPVFTTVSAAETAFNFDGGLVPSDGMVLASSDQSLFGTADRKQQARGITVHWITPDDKWGVSEMHRQALLRFWTLFCQEQGAHLASFSPDTLTVFSQAVQGHDRALMVVSPIPTDNGLTMRPPPAFRRQETPATQPPAVTVPAQSAPISIPAASTRPNPTLTVQKPAGPAISSLTLSALPQAKHGHIGIAALWSLADTSADTDVDLYVSSDSGRVPEVHWRCARSGDATYYRDIRQPTPSANGDWKTSWEYVEVAHDELERVSVWLNLFKSSSPRPVAGIIRLQWRGQTVDHPFAFRTNRGNGAADINFPARTSSPYWVRIDVLELFPQGGN